MTLLEVMIAMVVLLVAVTGTMATISSVGVLTDSSHQSAVAFAGAQRTLEELQGVTFSEIFARYNSDPSDDVGMSPGPNFTVDGLDPQKSDADGAVGEILFPVTDAAPTALFEDLDDSTFGLPLDLNGDGTIDGLDHSGDYQLLPVRVRVEWRDRSGNHFVELATILRER